MKKTAIFICGPTAVGKTSVAIEIAKWLQTEIISFDSRQFFRELKIGAAPPDEKELSEVKHHLIGQLSIEEDYNAGAFEADALKIMEDRFRTKDNLVLVGGSGLYMKALTEGFDEMPEIKPEVRNQLNNEFEAKGLKALSEELREKDPEYYSQVDLNNPQRVIRALEVIHSTGKPFSSFRKQNKATRDFDILKIGLNMPRPDLYERINLRVNTMIEAGLEQEVRSLEKYRDKNAMHTVGYREFIRYFDGELTREEAIEEIKKNSRRYAKRQLTWFRRDEEIRWFEPGDLEGMKEWVKEG